MRTPYAASLVFIIGLSVSGAVGAGSSDPVGRDDPELAHWLAAAESGDPGAQFELGSRYDEGDGVGENLPEAARWYAKAAQQGHVTAQLRLAWMYEHGDGVAADKAQAFAWFQRAAVAGNALAQYRVAWAYVNGDQVDKNPEQAKHWMRRAAQQGYADAQNALGYLYHRGADGGDYLQAARWYMAAIAQQHIFAVGNLADLMREQPASALRTSARVHYAPDRGSEVVGELPAGAAVVALDRATDWVAIVDKQRRMVGWVERSRF